MESLYVSSDHSKQSFILKQYSRGSKLGMLTCNLTVWSLTGICYRAMMMSIDIQYFRHQNAASISE